MKNPNHIEEQVSLKRIEGQIRGIQRMVDERKYCVDILTQVRAVMGALAKVENNILERHLEHCVARTVRESSPVERQKKFKEVIDLIHKFRKI